MNPCRPQEMEAVRGANVLNGTDENCTTWIKTYKDYKPGETHAPAPVQVNAPGDGASAGGRRRGGREARMARG
jgi:5-methyltetrahydrofolate--homocysteine methyltransferase